MLKEATIQKLLEMRFTAMASTFRIQDEDAALRGLSFDQRFGLLVDAEWTSRKNNRLGKLIRNANLQLSQACIENIEYHEDRKLNPDQILTLATCGYILQKHNIIIMGASGAGKTYLACAFGMAALRHFYSVKYVRLPELLNELAVARGEGVFHKTIKAYQNVRLLILDEWLLLPLQGQEARDLLEIIQARHKIGSTIFASQFAPAGWHGKIGENTLADAILDRIVHDSYTIMVEGRESMRKRKGINE